MTAASKKAANRRSASTSPRTSTADSQSRPTSPDVSRVAGPVYRSEGHRLLCSLADSGAAIARRIEASTPGTTCSKATVSAWRTGRKSPTPDMRRAVACAYPSIEVGAWDRRPGTAAAPSSPAPAVRNLRPSTIAEAEEILADIQSRRRTPDLTAGELAKLSSVAASLLVTVQKLQAIEDESDERIKARVLAYTLELGEPILDALRPYPDASRAVGEALRSLIDVDQAEVDRDAAAAASWEARCTDGGEAT